MKLSAIVPTLNEEKTISGTLARLRRFAPECEIIVVDGSSEDRTCSRAHPHCDLLLSGPRGRAKQMNLGAAHARGDVLVFLHADTLVPPGFADDIARALNDPSVVGGRFDLQLDNPGWAYRLLGWLISVRSRLSQVSTGDQAIFVRTEIFWRLGGFPDEDLCEDIAFSRLLKRSGRVACLRSRVTTSARRWEQHGLIRTILLMWTIKALFLAGVPSQSLAKLYRHAR